MPYFGAKNPMWKGGVSEYPNHGELKKNRLIVLKEASHICQVCGGTATEIHHKDKTKTNHKKENLVDICYLYVTSLITMTKIAKVFNCSNSTIKNILCAHSVPRNTKNHPPKCNKRGRPPKRRKMKKRRGFIVSRQLIPRILLKVGN